MGGFPLFIAIDLDATLSAWLPVTQGAYWEQFKTKVVNLGTNFPDAKIGLIVPAYVKAKTIADLNAQKNDFAGRIVGIDAGAGVLAAFDRDGRRLARGQIAGCTQWSDLLVVLRVQGRGRRVTPLVIPADAVDAAVFRALCVLGRRAARGALAAA